MSSNAWRVLSWPIFALGMCAPWITNCGQAGLPGGPKLPDGVSGGASCPDVSSVGGVEKFDFKQGFKLDAAGSAKLKAGTAAAIEIKGFSDKVDADLKAACATL